MFNRRNFLSLLLGGVTACFGIKKKKESVLAWAELPKSKIRYMSMEGFVTDTEIVMTDKGKERLIKMLRMTV